MQNGRKHLGMKNECLGNSNQGKHLAVGKKKKQRHSKRHSFLLGFYCCTVRRAVPFSTVALLSLSLLLAVWHVAFLTSSAIKAFLEPRTLRQRKSRCHNVQNKDGRRRAAANEDLWPESFSTLFVHQISLMLSDLSRLESNKLASTKL